MKKISFIILVFFIWTSSCKHEIINPGGLNSHSDSTGTGIGGSICFETDVLPIFSSSCAKSGCHNAASAQEGYVLDSYQNIIKKDIKPGDAAGSKIYRVLLETGDERMPKDQPPLTTLQIQRIAQWINEGAQNTTGCTVTACDTTHFAFLANVQPIFNTYCTSCHNTTDAATNGGVDLSNYNGAIVHIDHIPGVIQWLPGSQQMPQGGAKLSDCNIKIILQWIADGAKNN